MPKYIPGGTFEVSVIMVYISYKLAFIAAKIINSSEIFACILDGYVQDPSP